MTPSVLGLTSRHLSVCRLRCCFPNIVSTRIRSTDNGVWQYLPAGISFAGNIFLQRIPFSNTAASSIPFQSSRKPATVMTGSFSPQLCQRSVFRVYGRWENFPFITLVKYEVRFRFSSNTQIFLPTQGLVWRWNTSIHSFCYCPHNKEHHLE